MTFSRMKLLYEISTRKQETHTKILLYILSVSDHMADKSKRNVVKWWMFLSRLHVISFLHQLINPLMTKLYF